MKVCPDCLEAPAPEQRDGIKKDGRCRACIWEMRRYTKRMREALGDV